MLQNNIIISSLESTNNEIPLYNYLHLTMDLNINRFTKTFLNGTLKENN